MWLHDFKIAVIQKNTDKINTLLSQMPVFSTLEEMEKASYLLCEAQELLLDLQNEAKNSMLQIDKNIKFLKSTQTDTPSKFDLTL